MALIHSRQLNPKLTGSFTVSGSLSVNQRELDLVTVSRDQVLKFNGSKFVAADEGTTFVFTIADFDTNDGTSPQLIGTGS